MPTASSRRRFNLKRVPDRLLVDCTNNAFQLKFREREVTVTNSLNGGGLPSRFQSPAATAAAAVALPNVGYSSNAALRKPGPPPPPGIPLPTIAKPSLGAYR